jgi:hypothetical protein
MGFTRNDNATGFDSINYQRQEATHDRADQRCGDQPFRLTNRVTEWRKTSLRCAVQAKSEPGRILMPPSTSMPVQLEDLSITAVSSALGPHRDIFKILGVSGLTENRNYYHDAILLVYKDIGSNTLRLGAEVDGAWSEPHAAALEAIGAVERLGLSAAPVEDPHEPVGDPGTRLTRDEVIALQTAMSGQDQPRGDTDVLSRTAIRWLGVYEHPIWLDDALTNSQRRLLKCGYPMGRCRRAA